ncbi:MAG: acyl carrier protein [Ktedonobacteraceae bacterium]|nr:acyl carrier protein [Ktedonobacteraceae bacterium]
MALTCTHDMVINILATKVGVPANTPSIHTADWEALGVESLGLSEAVATLSLTLGIDLPHEEALITRNVSDLVALVNAYAQF